MHTCCKTSLLINCVRRLSHGSFTSDSGEENKNIVVFDLECNLDSSVANDVRDFSVLSESNWKQWTFGIHSVINFIFDS